MLTKSEQRQAQWARGNQGKDFQAPESLAKLQALYNVTTIPLFSNDEFFTLALSASKASENWQQLSEAMEEKMRDQKEAWENALIEMCYAMDKDKDQLRSPFQKMVAYKICHKRSLNSMIEFMSMSVLGRFDGHNKELSEQRDRRSDKMTWDCDDTQILGDGLDEEFDGSYASTPSSREESPFSPNESYDDNTAPQKWTEEDENNAESANTSISNTVLIKSPSSCNKVSVDPTEETAETQVPSEGPEDPSTSDVIASLNETDTTHGEDDLETNMISTLRNTLTANSTPVSSTGLVEVETLDSASSSHGSYEPNKDHYVNSHLLSPPSISPDNTPKRKRSLGSDEDQLGREDTNFQKRRKITYWV